MSNSESIPAILDTGAEITTLSFRDITRIMRCDTLVLRKFIKTNSEFKIRGVNSVWHPATLCYLRNVRVGELILPKFYFVLSESVNMNLLGHDFVNPCTLSKQCGSDIVVSDFDVQLYEDAASHKFAKHVPHELLYLTKKFDPIVWYRQLPAEYKDKLHQWSTPLYTVLNVGQYLDEFDGVLAGFRQQYGV